MFENPKTIETEPSSEENKIIQPVISEVTNQTNSSDLNDSENLNIQDENKQTNDQSISKVTFDQMKNKSDEKSSIGILHFPQLIENIINRMNFIEKTIESKNLTELKSILNLNDFEKIKMTNNDDFFKLSCIVIKSLFKIYDEFKNWYMENNSPNSKEIDDKSMIECSETLMVLCIYIIEFYKLNLPYSESLFRDKIVKIISASEFIFKSNEKTDLVDRLKTFMKNNCNEQQFKDFEANVLGNLEDRL